MGGWENLKIMNTLEREPFNFQKINKLYGVVSQIVNGKFQAVVINTLELDWRTGKTRRAGLFLLLSLPLSSV